MKPSRKLQKEMTPRAGVSSDEIKPLMCGLINAGGDANAFYNHSSILIHIKGNRLFFFCCSCQQTLKNGFKLKISSMTLLHQVLGSQRGYMYFFKV